MATVTTTASVSTPDAVPGSAPYKISRQSGKNQASVSFTPTHSAGSNITCYRIEVGGTGAPGTGTVVERGGQPCSDNRNDMKCSDLDASMKCSDGVALPSGVQESTAINDPSLSGADGAYTVYVYCGAADVALG